VVIAPSTVCETVTAPSNRYAVAVDADISSRSMTSRSACRDRARSATSLRVSAFGATEQSCPDGMSQVGFVGPRQPLAIRLPHDAGRNDFGWNDFRNASTTEGLLPGLMAETFQTTPSSRTMSTSRQEE